MGYTHYWKNEQHATEEQWNNLVHHTNQILNRAKSYVHEIALDIIDLNDDSICFNGAEPQDYETFEITPFVQTFGFCKTARKPYDAVVVAVLMAAAEHCPGYSWTSDGEPDDHAEGLDLFTKTLTTGETT